MTGKYMGKICGLLALVLMFGSLCGCQYGDIYIQESSYESTKLIEGWLAYKAQVEDTTKFAKGVEKTPEAAAKDHNEQKDLETEAVATETETAEKKPYVQQTSKVDMEKAVVQPLVEHGFYYQYLSDSLKVVYDEMLRSMLLMEGVKISTLSSEQADFAFQCVLYDHPEIFYVSGYQLTKKTMDGSVIELSFSGEYILSKEEIIERQKQIDAYTTDFCKKLWDGMDEYEKVKAVYDHLITNTTYNLNALDNQNICSVFLTGQSVCQGYAEATQYLLQTLGIEASIVSGIVSDGERHAWNIVKVNGSYYYVDTTWGDADYRIVDENGEIAQSHTSQINYDYFMVTTAQLELTHQIQSEINLPICVETKDNYYIREDLFFDEVNEEQIAAAFERAYASGQGTVTLRASDSIVFAALKEYMITDQKVFQYIESSGTISYSEDVKTGTLCFWL